MLNPIAGIHRMLLKVFGSRNERIVKTIWPLVSRINALEPEMKRLSDEALQGKTAEFRDRLANGISLDDLLPEAFAAVREVSFRNLRTSSGTPMRHFDVQLIGGVVLHSGKIAEMMTGEGKTLVATLPAYLNALTGRGVHVITVNDYLAQRDCNWMSPVFGALGMTVGAIQSQMDPAERQKQYACDITYGTNNEFGFDYLRDNMKTQLSHQVQQRGRHFAIVDEVDSILIDEARTPLIISGPAEKTSARYDTANRVAKRLVRGQDFEVKEKERSVMLTEAGIEKAQKIVGVPNFYAGKDMEWPHLLEQALRAHQLYHRDVEYVIRDGEVVIVDEFTGRLMEGRTWSDGLHQAVEAKEGLSIREENQTLATITLQNYFKLYEKLAGMTGTAMTEAVEFDRIYKLEVVAIPPNRPVRRIDGGDVVYRTSREKYNAILDEIVTVNGQGLPILVGTVSVEKSELLSGMLRRRGVAHDVLNAKHHQREAEIVALAGQEGRVTISTNMAGRGTDIVLGPGIGEKGGLHVIGTERHEARRIDNQLRGRCARQGDPGSSKFFLCLEDDLMRRFASDRVGSILKRLGMKEGEEISHPWVTRSIERAQKKVENYHFEIRKNLLEYDAVMNEQRGLVYQQRQDVLEGKGLDLMVRDMMVNVLNDRVPFYLSLDVPAPGDLAEDGSTPNHPLDELTAWLRTAYGLDLTGMSGIVRDRSLPEQSEAVIERILEAWDSAYAQKSEKFGKDFMRRIEQWLLLVKIDEKWKDHLHAMDHLRSAIGLRSVAQIDPKVAYKQEGYRMFKQMIESLRSEVTQLILRVEVRREDEQELKQRDQLANAEYRHGGPGDAPVDRRSPETENSGDSAPKGPIKPIVNKGPKVGRNDNCPCGSGKKFKRCCGVGHEG